MSDRAKKRLLVLLGAGSTIHAGAPSTTEITDRICKISDDPTRSIVAHLWAQRGKGKDGFNFETVLACLEELEEFTVRRKYPLAWDRVGGVLSAVADLQPSLLALPDASFSIARWGLTNGLSHFFIRKTSGSSADRLRHFVGCLKEHFDLTIVTLNYDDLIDQTDTWYDGFELPPNGAAKRFGSFDSARFRQKSKDHASVLLHLHGSIRFGYDPDSAGSDVVRYTNGREALESVKKKSATRPQLTAPLISGQHKDRYMTRAPVPFGYYHSAFVDAACECSRVLIAGYGGRDLHINAWISEEGARLHGCSRRVVWIDPIAPANPLPPHMLVLSGGDGAFPPTDPKRLDEIIRHLSP